jgi:sulfite exporter TauE/SafE
MRTRMVVKPTLTFTATIPRCTCTWIGMGNLRARSRRRWRESGCTSLLRPLAIGIVHGLAGSAAVALLVLTTIREPRWAIVYLLVFGVGTIAGMMLITMMIGVPFAYTGRRFENFNRGLGIASGLISVAFGLFVTFQIGFVDGLFRANPHWTPH